MGGVPIRAILAITILAGLMSWASAVAAQMTIAPAPLAAREPSTFRSAEDG